MTVYIVTSGEYSDYGINAVFSIREEAERFIAAAERTSEVRESASAEEWLVDERAGEVPRTRWSCRIEFRSGRIWGQDFEDVMALPAVRSEDGYQVGSPGFESFCARSYVSAEHAQKLAVEARQKWLRERAIEQQHAMYEKCLL